MEKVLLRYRERFWPVTPSGYLWWADEGPTWREWADLTDGLGAPVLALMAAGADAEALHAAAPGATVAARAHAAVVAMSKVA